MFYKINTYGCQMNVHESEKIAGMLTARNYSETDDVKKADIIIFNTCCIREGAETKAFGNIGAVKNLKKKNPSLIIAVLGCMPQKEGTADELKQKFPFIDIILGTHNLSCLGEKIDYILQNKNGKIKPFASEILSDSDMPLYSDSGVQYRTSGSNAWVNIIYGCNNFCTYCIVPYVRGREKSRPPKDIVEEIDKLLASGKYREITLLGQNVNSYGNDFEDKSTNFASLLKQITALDYDFRLKFMTSHPKDLSDEVIEIIAGNSKMSKFIHLPVQSGSNGVLKAMNRKYTREDYLKLINKIRTAIPEAGLSSDLMVGFPGETEQDFLDTLDLVNEVKFDNLYMFIYSKRSGTAADKMSGQIPEEIKTDRINRLVALQRKISANASKKYVGQILTGLISEDGESAMSDNGKLILSENGKFADINEFKRIRIIATKSSKLIGRLES